MPYRKFIFGETIERALDAIPEEHQLRFYRIVKDYGLHGIEPELSGFELAVWVQMKDVIGNTMPAQDEKPSVIKKAGAPFRNQNAKTKDSKSEPETIKNNSEQLKQFKTTHPNEKGNENENVNENENEKEKEEEGACAPAFSLSENLNPNQKEISEQTAAMSAEWNSLDIGAPFKKAFVNLSSFEQSDLLLFFRNHSPPEAIQAMRNYKRVLTEPDFDPGGCKGYSFISFLVKGVDRYCGEAKPFERFKPEAKTLKFPEQNQKQTEWKKAAWMDQYKSAVTPLSAGGKQ